MMLEPWKTGRPRRGAARRRLARLGALILMAAMPRGLAAAPDSPADSLGPTSAHLDSLEARMSRNWLTRMLSDYLFVGSARSLKEQGNLLQSVDIFAPYAGRVIRTIDIERLDVFTDYDPQTGDKVQTTLDRVGEAIHVKTRPQVIRRYLLMQPGEPLDPNALADTERLLRGASFVQEAQILVLPVAASPDSVDLLVITRDRWTLGLDVKVKKASSYDIRLADRNFVGWGHVLDNRLLIDTDRSQEFGYVGQFRIENIRGTLVRNLYEYRNTYLETGGQFRLSRDREVPQVRSTGALGLVVSDLKAQAPEDDRELFLNGNVWLGRAFPVGGSPFGGVGRAALVLAGGYDRLDYRDRPDSVSLDVNRRFHDRTRLLASLSFTESSYREGRLISSYGRTEDVPYGILATLTGGAELGEFDHRGYAAAELRLADATPVGYVSAAGAIGAFVKNEAWEDGVAEGSVDYFSPLLTPGRFGWRQFARVGYTFGFRRRENDVLPLDDATGLTGIRDSDLADRQRLVGALESVLFTPWTAFGFRFAMFGTWSTGTVGPDADSFLQEKYYSSLGFGVRIHNERLVFDPLELRFTLALSRPEGSVAEDFDFGNTSIRRYPSLDPGAPSVLPYR